MEAFYLKMLEEIPTSWYPNFQAFFPTFAGLHTAILPEHFTPVCFQRRTAVFFLKKGEATKKINCTDRCVFVIACKSIP
ncbi:MAG: hypothetical protein K9J37_00555 [Saprospiraceae bacterium]|nr:hypothetical protein [Saprospiraceae bacterium]MCF8248364.1 hypothetical protein [Saprospiraceae bacterium]MCF8283230.1 hypothetical protein [Bacteroidales bacterium]MCF8309892.1 hypothetical protein [Saprospiraceae bacterium]MCF8438777.1 hypothetical protein [Saprospiraceae bacterium]